MKAFLLGGFKTDLREKRIKVDRVAQAHCSAAAGSGGRAKALKFAVR